MNRNCLITLFAFVLWLDSASATDLLYEGFDYTAGAELKDSVNPDTGEVWTRPAGPRNPAAGSSDSLNAFVGSEGLAHPDLPAGVGNSFSLPRLVQSNISIINVPGSPYTYDGTETSLFFSFLFKLTDWAEITDAIAASTNHRNGDFIAGFTFSDPENSMASAGVYAGQVRIRRELDGSATQTGKYELGVHKNNAAGGTAFIQWDDAAFDVGDTVFIVGEYEFGTADTTDDTVRMWINPPTGETMVTPSLVVSNGSDVATDVQLAINSFWFRDGSTFIPGPALVDELRLGTTFASVTPAIPEPDTMLLTMILALLVGASRKLTNRNAFPAVLRKIST